MATVRRWIPITLASGVLFGCAAGIVGIVAHQLWLDSAAVIVMAAVLIAGLLLGQHSTTGTTRSARPFGSPEDGWTADVRLRSETSGSVSQDADAVAFQHGRPVLLAQGALLIVLGVWAGVATAVGGEAARALVFHVSWPFAGVLLVTGAASTLSTLSRKAGTRYVSVQAVAYLLLFVYVSATPSVALPPLGFDTADDFLFLALAILGLVMVMWLFARAMTASTWPAPPTITRERGQ